MRGHAYNCPCCSGSPYVESQLGQGDKRLKEKVKIRGSVPLPATLELDSATIDAAIAFWQEMADTALEEILYAAPVTTPTEAEFDDIRGDWEWDNSEYAYKNNVTNEKVDEGEKNEIFNAFLDAYILYLLAESAALIKKNKTLNTWSKNLTEKINYSIIISYSFGIGGKNVLDAEDLQRIKDIAKIQTKYFRDFANDIRSGNLSGAQVLNRTALYGESSTNSYEQSKVKSHGIRLPEYPGDGNQVCLSNCRCHWDLKDDGDYVNATWTLNPTAEHCVSCVNNSQKWNPLRVKKGGGENK